MGYPSGDTISRGRDFAMEIQTRFGLGGTAFFTVAGSVQPLFGWWVSGPLMVICAMVAVWGFWPIVSNFRWPWKTADISLFDAVKEAYGSTRGTSVSEMAEYRSDSPLFWYVYYFDVVAKIPIYGTLRFSPKRERVELNNYTPELIGNKIILKEVYGNKILENLCVKRSDLKVAFKRLQETARGTSSH
jgi:hypothetical protein